MIHVTTRGLGAQDHDVELEPLSLLVGPNGSGKSSIMNAIRIAALQFVPALGKTEAATATLMSGRELEVTLSLPAARAIRQKLTRGTKSLSWKTECSWLGNEASDSEQAREALRLFADDAASAAEVMDIRELLALPGPQRAARIERLVAADQDQERQLIRLGVLSLKEIAAKAINASGDALPDDVKKLRPLVPGWSEDEGQHTGQYAALIDVWKMFKPKMLDAGLTPASAWINEEKRAAALDKLKKERARDELALRLQEIPEPDADEIARLEQRRASVEQQVGAAGERASEAEGRRQKVAKADNDIARAKSAAASAHAARDTYEGNANRAIVLRQRIADLEVGETIAQADATLTTAVHSQRAATMARSDYERDAATAKTIRERMAKLDVGAPPAPPDSSDLAALVTDAARLDDEAGKIELPEVPSTTAAEALVADAESTLSNAKESPWQAVLTKAEEVATRAEKWKGQATYHALCQALVDDITHLIEQQGLSVHACELALESATKALEQRRAEVEAAQQRRADLSKEREGLRNSAKKLRDQVDADRQRRQEQHQAAVEAFERETEAIRQEEADLDEQLANLGMLGSRDGATAAAIERTADALRAAEEARQSLTGTPELGQEVLRDGARMDRSECLTRDRTEIAQLGDLNKRDRETSNDVTRTAEALRAAEEHRSSLGDAPGDIGAEDEALTQERDEVTGKLTALLDARAQHRQLTEVIAEIDRLVARHAVLNAIEEACKRLRADEVARQGGPLLDILRTYLRAAGRKEEPFIEAKRTSCDFGWIRRAKDFNLPADQRVSVGTLGEGEFGLYAAGLTAALLILRVAPVRILLVEGAGLDSPTLEQMLRGIAALKDEITAAVVAAWHGEGMEVPGWTTMTAKGERLSEAA